MGAFYSSRRDSQLPTSTTAANPIAPENLLCNSSSIWECIICRDATISSSVRIPERAPTTMCQHPANVCMECLDKYVESMVKSHGLAEIKCPGTNCKNTLSWDDVRMWAAPDTFLAYDTMLLQQAISKEPDFRWCKNPYCRSGQVHTGGDALTIMICQACGSKSCFTHDVLWHAGRTCAQYDGDLPRKDNEIVKEEAASSDYLKKKTQACPSCRRRVIKESGCDHMTCHKPGGCGHEFCWLCFAPYGEIRKHGNHLHLRTCTYFAE